LREMHALDINCIVGELAGLAGSRVDKVFQDRPDLIRIRFYGGELGRSELVVEAGRRIHLTKFKRQAPKTPTSFAMYLRKHLGNRRLTTVRQHDFDRIVSLEFEDLGLVVELFAKGNVVLVDADGDVMLSLKKGQAGRVQRGNRYQLPPPPGSPFDISDENELSSSLKQKDLVRSLAVDLGLGRLYANEICALSGIDTHASPSELTAEDRGKVLEAIERLKAKADYEKRPVVYYETIPVEYAPFSLSSLSHMQSKFFPTFNEAADEYYTFLEVAELKQKASESAESQIAKLKKRLEIQSSQYEELKTRAAQLRRSAETVYSSFAEVSRFLEAAATLRPPTQQSIRRLIDDLGLPWSFISFDPKSKVAVVEIQGARVPMELGRTAGEVGGRLFERAKALEKRASGAEAAMAETLKTIRTLEERPQVQTPPEPVKRRRTEWFEKFRWFFTSSGLLVLAGRDRSSNETLVRRYMEERDLYVHADVHGAPSTVIKAGTGEIDENSIRQACAFALIHSKLWSSGTTAGDVYWVRADQVTKRPTSGEYVPTGAFVIRGTRNYYRGLEARCGVGWLKDKFMCGPLDAVRENCGKVIEIQPGPRKKSEVAKEILQAFREAPSADMDQLMQVLPPGPLRIVH